MQKKSSLLSLRRWLPVGTLSLLIGVHQIIWHPYTVWRAWRFLYGPPSWRELLCIIIHDWGYWGKPNMDGSEGERHPEVAAKLAGWLLGEPYRSIIVAIMPGPEAKSRAVFAGRTSSQFTTSLAGGISFARVSPASCPSTGVMLGSTSRLSNQTQNGFTGLGSIKY